jgi:hypothetical protein
MHRSARRLALATLLVATFALAAPGAAVERGGVRMEVLIDGRPAEEFPARGKRYLQAFRNKEYAVRLTNDTGGRVAVALAVDGLNSVDAKHTTAADATKWVLGPWESIVVEGWQVGRDHARKFLFTTEQKSYGEWLGDARNLGVISAVAFGEKRRRVTQRPWWSRRSGGDEDGAFGGAAGEGTDSKRAPRSIDREAEASSSPALGKSSSADHARRRGDRASRKPKDHAATGIGRRLEHEVEWVDFDMDPTPIATLSLRYGFRDELVSLGVLPARRRADRTLNRRESAGGFAPDPGRPLTW